MVERVENLPNPERFANIQSFRDSYALTRRINTDQLSDGPAKEALNDKIPESIYGALAGGSDNDRNKYWKEKAPTKTYGEQMLEWLHGSKERGTAGISAWIDAQKDPEVQDMLSGVMLFGDNTRDISAFRQSAEVKSIVDSINATLSGNKLNPADSSSLSDTDIRSLLFYQTFLNSKAQSNAPTLGTEELIAYLVSGTGLPDNPSQQDIDKAFAKLQKVAPLLVVTGQEAQHAFAAVIAAKMHSESGEERGKVENTDVTATKPSDKKALDFLRNAKKLVEENASQETEPGEGEIEEGVPLVDYFAEVADPPARKEESQGYWIEGKIPTPDEVLSELTPEQLKAWERIEPFWDENNRTNFEPAQKFQPENNQDSRFAQLEALTDNDSGLLALAGIAAETPEEQARLFQVFGAVILKIHKSNPDLLKAFLEKQVEGNGQAMEIFIRNEQSTPIIKQVQKQLFSDFKLPKFPPESEEEGKVFGDAFNKLYTSDTPDGREFKQQFGALQGGIVRYLLQPLSASGDKLLAFSPVEVQPNMVKPEYNPEQTVAQWKQRLESGELENALNAGKLTEAQIRQIEFLSHAVRIADENEPTVIKWLQERAKNTSPTTPEPTEPAEPPAPTGGDDKAKLEAAAKVAGAVIGGAEAVHEAHQRQEAAEQSTNATGSSEEDLVGAAQSGLPNIPPSHRAEPAPVPPSVPPTPEMENFEATATTEGLSSQELGKELAERAKTIEDLEKWKPTKHIITLHENEYNDQRHHEDSTLVKALTESLHAYQVDGDVVTRAVGSNEMKAILAQQGIRLPDGQADVLFSPGFSPALAMFDGRMHERIGTKHAGPDDRDKGGYIVVFKREGPLSQVTSSVDGGDIGVSAPIPLEGVVGLYRIDRKEEGGLLGWRSQKEVSITQLLPGAEQESQTQMGPPPAPGGVAAAIAQTQPPPATGEVVENPDGGGGGKPPETDDSVEATATIDRASEKKDRVKEIQKKLAQLLEKHKEGEPLTEEEIDLLGLLDTALNPEIDKSFIESSETKKVFGSLNNTYHYFTPPKFYQAGSTLNPNFGKETIVLLTQDLRDLNSPTLGEKSPISGFESNMDKRDRYVLVGDAKSIFGVNGDSRQPLVLLSDAYLVSDIALEEQPVAQLLQKAYPGMQFVFPEELVKALEERKSEKPQTQSASSSSWHNDSGRQRNDSYTSGRGSVTA